MAGAQQWRLTPPGDSLALDGGITASARPTGVDRAPRGDKCSRHHPCDPCLSPSEPEQALPVLLEGEPRGMAWGDPPPPPLRMALSSGGVIRLESTGHRAAWSHDHTACPELEQRRVAGGGRLGWGLLSSPSRQRLPEEAWRAGPQNQKTHLQSSLLELMKE